MVERSAVEAVEAAPAVITPGAIRAGDGHYVFDMSRANAIDAPTTPPRGARVEGERVLVGLMHMPRGTGGTPHTHPNEQWIHVIKGTLVGEVDGVAIRAPAGSVIFVPAGVVHCAYAAPDEDAVFFTAKGRSHGIGGTPAKPANG